MAAGLKVKTFGILGLLLLVLGIALVTMTRTGSGEVEKQLREFRRAGLPVTPEELNQWYQLVPEAENAALLVLEAIRQHVSDPRISKIDIAEGEPLSQKAERAVAEYVRKNRETLEKLHQAARLPRSRYPVDFSAKPIPPQSYLLDVRDLTRLLRWEAMDQSRRGNTTPAVQAVRSGFLVTQTLRREPTLLSLLVGASATEPLISGLEWLLNRHQLTRGEIAGLIELLHEVETTQGKAVLNMLLSEMVLGKELFLELHSRAERHIGLGGLIYGLKAVTGMKQRDLAMFLQTMNDFQRVATNRYPEIIQASVKAGRSAEERFDAATLAGFSPDWLGEMLSPPIAKIIKREAIFLAKLRCLQVVLAIESFRLDHEGELPRTLADLAGVYLQQIPENPFDATPLVYEKHASTYQISAPAPNNLFEDWQGTNVVFQISR